MKKYLNLAMTILLVLCLTYALYDRQWFNSLILLLVLFIPLLTLINATTLNSAKKELEEAVIRHEKRIAADQKFLEDHFQQRAIAVTEQYKRSNIDLLSKIERFDTMREELYKEKVLFAQACQDWKEQRNREYAHLESKQLDLAIREQRLSKSNAPLEVQQSAYGILFPEPPNMDDDAEELWIKAAEDLHQEQYEKEMMSAQNTVDMADLHKIADIPVTLVDVKPKKTVREWIQDLPEDVRQRFLKNTWMTEVDLDSKTLALISLESCISSSFTFSGTPEGREYWYLVSTGKYEEAQSLLSEKKQVFDTNI